MKRNKLLFVGANVIILLLLINPVVNSITLKTDKNLKYIENNKIINDDEINTQINNNNSNFEDYILGKVIICFNTKLDEIDFINVSRIDNFLGHNIIKKIEGLNVALVEVEEGIERSFIENISNSSFVKYAELNYVVNAFHTPNDPKWNEQWGPKRIHCEDAWNIVQGSTVIKIAIIDTGIDYNHEDLNGNYLSGGYDFVNDDNDPMDDEGHGSHCSGIAAAVIDNNKGIAGISQVSIVAEKVLDSNGYGSSFDVAAGIIHAVDTNVDIISMSLGSRYPSSTIETACNNAYNAGALLIAASGNDYSSQISYPAAYDSVIAVGAIDNQDKRCGFSNYGENLELMAPGENIISVKIGGGYVEKDGTSMACPHVTGVAALVKSVNYDMSNKEIRQLLIETAEDLGSPGKDIYYGNGLVNARAVCGNGGYFEEIICGTQTSKRSGDIYNYNSCQVSMGEHIFGGDATAWYDFDIGDVKVAEGMEVGIEFADWGWIGDGPNIYAYNWIDKKYTCLGIDVGSNDGFKWIWIKTTNSYKYVNNEGMVEVKVWAEDDDWTILYHIGVRGRLIKPDLECSDNLDFGYVKPSESVIKNITVENIGNNSTELDWYIYSWPKWGTWIFTPSSGNDLRPEDGKVIVSVSVTAPNTQDYFTGQIKVVNENDEYDYELIDVSILTRKDKSFSNNFIILLQKSFDVFLRIYHHFSRFLDS
ncbi:hypothetical protein AYK24_02220 [Thermoplasmatales archaeon SG8-52-4]|nr:MAG: hypothetical protein AYK24_02220 [Thermoplasmatales archaeon SG8-52-4]